MTSSVHALRETQPNVTLIERLIAAGLISELQLRRALQEKARHERPLGKILVELGMISEKVLSETLHELLGEPRLDLRALIPQPNAIAMVSKEAAERCCVLPIEFDDEAQLLTLAATEPFDLAADEELFQSIRTGVDIATVVAPESEIKAAIRKFYGINLAIPDILGEIDGVPSDQLGAVSNAPGYAHPLVRLVDAIVMEASRRRASAIHFEPERGFLRVRFRIDGVLSQVMALHQSYWQCMQDRLVEMSAMDSDEDDRLHTGSTSMVLGQRDVTLYFSRQVTFKGNCVVVRIVERYAQAQPLDGLGLDSEAFASLRLMLARPDGLVVIAGAPGSGKSSTLHSILSYRSDESVAIVTHEQPTAATVPSIRQTQVFAGDDTRNGHSLESLLQQDADVLMVDELRDEQAAAAALRAASSGRQVFAALTAGSALAALARLQEFGLQPRQISGNLGGIVFQCLLRKLCPDCKQAYTPQPFEQRILHVSKSKDLQLYREVGCEHCNYLGFKGRVAVFELLALDDALNELLEKGSTSIEIRRVAEAAGFRNLVEQVVPQVITGVTSLAEASRVIDLSARLK
ncbi:MAG: ATPase, T2SS/T4P/T4SS family [Woeseiaceae bacterium]